MSNLHDLDTEYHFKTYKRYPVTLTRGQGSHVWDTEGNEYIDALAGIAVNNVGHCHPKVVKAIQEQAPKLIHTSNFFTTEPQVELAKTLVELSDHDRVFFCNSGTEAIEGALKLAKRYANKTGKTGDIITMTGAFHGRTLGALAMGQEKYQQGFEPMLSGFRQVPFGDIDALTSVVNDARCAMSTRCCLFLMKSSAEPAGPVLILPMKNSELFPMWSLWPKAWVAASRLAPFLPPKT